MTQNTTTNPAVTFGAGVRRCLLALVPLLGLHFGIPSVQADTLYVSNLDNNTIVSFDTTASPPTPTTFASTGLDHPYFLAFDAAGNLYAANSCKQHDRAVHAGRSGQRLRQYRGLPYGAGVRLGRQPLRGQHGQQHDPKVHARRCGQHLREHCGAQPSRGPGVRRGR